MYYISSMLANGLCIMLTYTPYKQSHIL